LSSNNFKKIGDNNQLPSYRSKKRYKIEKSLSFLSIDCTEEENQLHRKESMGFKENKITAHLCELKKDLMDEEQTEENLFSKKNLTKFPLSNKLSSRRIRLMYNHRQKIATLTHFTLMELRNYVVFKFPEARKALMIQETQATKTHFLLMFYIHSGPYKFFLHEDQDLHFIQDNDIVEVIIVD